MIIFFLIPSCNGFCEAYWRSNISAAYSSSENLSEPDNAISSLTYTLFGLIGLFLNNYSSMYYFLMNIFIMLGLMSFLHHYYYYDADWAYEGDLFFSYMLLSISLVYIICDNEYFKYKIVNNILGLTVITNYMLIEISDKSDKIDRIVYINVIVYGIFISQGLIVVYFFIINSNMKYRMLLCSLWNFGLGTLGYNLWLYDRECTKWALENKFNGHMIWHISLAWSLFNTINVTNVSRYSFNKVKFIWKPLFKCCPWFLHIIILNNNNNNNNNNIEVNKIYEITNIKIDPSYDTVKIKDNISEFNLLINKPGRHRRSKTFS